MRSTRIDMVRNFRLHGAFASMVGPCASNWEATMHQLIYLVGLIVVIMAILSFFGLR